MCSAAPCSNEPFTIPAVVPNAPTAEAILSGFSMSLRPDQVPQVRKSLERYRQVKETLEAISELNQEMLRLDRDEAKVKKIQP
jgi:response regulator of citrate/malate metabolism